jgi:NhaA family Na+:H+ antiporter
VIDDNFDSSSVQPTEGVPVRVARDVAPPQGWLTRYLHLESLSALALALAAVVALVLANSDQASAYAAWLERSVTLVLAGHAVTVSVHGFIDDGLMTLFFFTVGLEIRRELHAGELAEPRRAVLPAAAALGGMAVPALVYIALNPDPSAQRGFGIPMATDIAFAMAALALLGRRITPALRVLLLALAILDDIGGIIVIAVFYADGIVPRGLVVATIGVVLALGMRDNGVRSRWPFIVPAVVTWVGLWYAGVHPTMAGVLMGLLTPPQRGFGLPADAPIPADARSHSERLQTALHPWVAFVVMPLFAFANAGVTIDASAADPRIVAGVGVGLVLGKPLGILAVAWLAVRLRVASLPIGVGWSGVAVVGTVAGVGFTVALFIAGLAFSDPTALASAKLGILGGSLLAVVLGLLAGRIALSPQPVVGAAETVEEAERATER